jgi:hypothetical protein
MQGNGCYSQVWWNCKREVWLPSFGCSMKLSLQDNIIFKNVFGSLICLPFLGMAGIRECRTVRFSTRFWEKTWLHCGRSHARVSLVCFKSFILVVCSTWFLFLETAQEVSTLNLFGYILCPLSSIHLLVDWYTCTPYFRETIPKISIIPDIWKIYLPKNDY